MRNLSLILMLAVLVSTATAQTPRLTASPSDAEWQEMLNNAPYTPATGARANPAYPDMIVPGEFEESQAVMVTWSKYATDHVMQCQLINAIQQEVEAWIVIHNANDSNVIKSKMNGQGFNTANCKYKLYQNDAFWIRDYGPVGFYYDGLDSVGLIDLQYYSTRPLDDAVPWKLGAELNYPVYGTSMFYEGGNFMTDGFGAAFYSTRLQENNALLNGPTWTTQAVNDTVKRVFNMDINYEPQTLECDGGTGHIDIYLKLLDERTLLVAEYGSSVTAQDRLIIEDNLTMLETLSSTYNRPYKIVRMPLPTRDNGTALTTCNHLNNDIRGFVNGLFVNKTYIFPSFSDGVNSGNVAKDQEAIALYEKFLPGYNIVPIDARGLTPLGGALHCITMQIPAENPLRFWHPPVEGYQPLQNNFPMEAEITNANGIASANIKWRLVGQTAWNTEALTFNGTSSLYEGNVPNNGFTSTDTVEYYIESTANNGKYSTKPLTAPDGFYRFWFGYQTGAEELAEDKFHLFNPYPNPTAGTVTMRYFSERASSYQLRITDLTGKVILVQQHQAPGRGLHEFTLEGGSLAQGSYFCTLSATDGRQAATRMLVVR